ncbi:hypothetical protein [Kitasatospora sp. NPDC094011]|uniref:hypothetical protein n=1 Tax=Kitasatospora sp. NPDC094011 TaxID=3364090 RepID=UPI00381734C6
MDDAGGELASAGEAAELQRLFEQAGPLDDVFARGAADTAAIATTVARSWHQRADEGPVPGGDLAEAHYTRVMLTLRSAGPSPRSARGWSGCCSTAPATPSANCASRPYRRAAWRRCRHAGHWPLSNSPAR